jgi:glyceraldehyde 3-phosphate dehydrogenase
MVSTGVNGFGRFGLHLLKYWLDNNKDANFSIDFINDDFLSPSSAHAIIINDRFVRISEDYRVVIDGDTISFINKSGLKKSILFSNSDKEQIPWRGEPQYMLECSGKYNSAKLNRDSLVGATKKNIISATVADADQTLIMGYNNDEYSPKAQIFSYGSCIINAFVPLTNWLNEKYKINNCDTAVIHNIPEHKLLKPDNHTLNRRSCSLEWMGPKLMDCLTPDNFIVTKTYIPYPGISMIDMRYQLAKPPATIKALTRQLAKAFNSGPLKTLYAFDKASQGAESHLNSTYSAVLRRDGLRFVGDNLYISCYFDNENSVNRYFDLINFMANHPD